MVKTWEHTGLYTQKRLEQLTQGDFSVLDPIISRIGKQLFRYYKIPEHMQDEIINNAKSEIIISYLNHLDSTKSSREKLGYIYKTIRNELLSEIKKCVDAEKSKVAAREDSKGKTSYNEPGFDLVEQRIDYNNFLRRAKAYFEEKGTKPQTQKHFFTAVDIIINGGSVGDIAKTLGVTRVGGYQIYDKTLKLAKTINARHLRRGLYQPPKKPNHTYTYLKPQKRVARKK